MKKQTKAPWPELDIDYTVEQTEVRNPYTGIKTTLNPVELAVYDMTIGSYHLGLYDDYYKGKNWFIENNPDAYFILID